MADPKPVSASAMTFVRPMTQLDANVLGNVHGGVIMREVDTAAGTAAARHAGQVCVTAAIDELSFIAPVYIGDLLIVQAAVNDVGKTSLEVGVRVEAERWDGGDRRHTTSAFLVFVCVDEHGKAAPVPPLLVETADEQRRQAQARIRRQVRKERIDRLGSYLPETAPDASPRPGESPRPDASPRPGESPRPDASPRPGASPRPSE